MQDEFEAATQKIQEAPGPTELELEEVSIRPRKADINVSTMALAWKPWSRKKA